MVALRNAYERGSKSGITFKKPSLTQQHFKDDCDINKIIERFTRTGLMPQYPGEEMHYGDYTSSVDYHEAMTIVAQAREQFEALPSAVRDKFDNDPAKMLDFVSKKENIEESVKLGLLNSAALEIIKDIGNAGSNSVVSSVSAGASGSVSDTLNNKNEN